MTPPQAQNSYDLALECVHDGDIVGLGSGRAATAFVKTLGARVAQGLQIKGVATSRSTERLAADLGIPLVTLDAVESIDVDVDGADEVDPQANLIKGLGGALVREKLVAQAARRLVILVTPEKLVSKLGQRGILPVEVVPFGLESCRRRLRGMGMDSKPRLADDGLLVTDNGNYILDCQVSEIPDPGELDRRLCAMPGIVGTGLFVGFKPTVFVQDGSQVFVFSKGGE